MIVTTCVNDGTLIGENLVFGYDASGIPMTVTYNDDVYYYITNLQGDVMQLVDANGTAVASYDYDPYGKVISATGTMAEINPIRYRGYVYDTESGLYYLQSRYYNPEIGRFLNADAIDYLGVGSNLAGYNLFSYCGNNPILGYDPSGYFSLAGAIIASGTIVGGLLGAFSAATSGGNILESAIEGCLTGAVGAACGILIEATGAAVTLAAIGGAIIDFATQATVQYINTQKVDLKEIDTLRIARTSALTGFGTAIPKIGEGAKNAVDTFTTALVWAEGSTLLSCADVTFSHAWEKLHPSQETVSTGWHYSTKDHPRLLLK